VLAVDPFGCIDEYELGYVGVGQPCGVIHPIAAREDGGPSIAGEAPAVGIGRRGRRGELVLVVGESRQDQLARGC